jgi:hypothetical protein
MMMMILRRHPDCPSTQLAIGYWKSKDQPTLPDPRDYVDESWDKTERDGVILYLRGSAAMHHWKGPSNCRICGVSNGSRCMSDNAYVWPEGFPHYLEAHAVKPPQAFIEHVLHGGRCVCSTASEVWETQFGGAPSGKKETE